MKKLTKIATATTLGLGLSVSAMASENSNLAVQPSADLSYAFDDSQDLQVIAISNQEMEETEGAVAPWAVGAAVGATWQGANYAYGAYRGKYNWNTAKFAGNVASGAVIGGSFGAAGKIASGGAKFIPSLTNSGANIWRGNSAIANWGANHAWRND